MSAIALLVGVLACILVAPLASDFLSLLRLARDRRPTRRSATPDHPRLLVLVPAHNEARLIGSCIQSLRAMRYPSDRVTITVIADNCSDRTAALARRAGAECLERDDLARPGKPQAIAWALAQLPVLEFDAVTIIDADVVVDAEFANGLAHAAPLRSKVIQPYNDVRNPADNAVTRMAAVLSAANHRIAYGLKTRVGLNVPLSAGMTIGTDLLANGVWEAFSLGEDWELYALLTARGITTESNARARLFAEEARSLRQSASQRHRWAAGKLTVLFRYAPMLLRTKAIGAHQKFDVFAELLGVGPAVHLGMVTALAAVVLLVHVPGAPWLAGALALSLARPATYALVALPLEPQPWRTALAFTYLPVYALWRMGVQLTALKMLGNKPWVRTQRNH